MQGLIGWSSDRTRSGSGRRARRGGTGEDGAGAAAPARSSSDRERLKASREWARENGHPNLGDRGRVPQAIVAEYDQAH